MARGSDEGEGALGAGGTRSVRRTHARFAGDEGGTTAVEYTLIAGFIGLALIAGMRIYSDKIVLVYQTLAAALTPP
ncbi:hypothetical protein ASF28_10790 [Methylobacterium sp. Leaf99]|uniref:Flp family type IVb pilin n=1 Tax=Methylobacterium sp. Leaf99 TaxID=1736251 RepID=UPI0007017523|nr:Flp family type IVb pilin [Methylobacterium sp. Leaf99]KQP07616.1 hypothetical protein ASF28_10790 [Methylobacterium sp. Leaf99]